MDNKGSAARTSGSSDAIDPRGLKFRVDNIVEGPGGRPQIVLTPTDDTLSHLQSYSKMDQNAPVGGFQKQHEYWLQLTPA